MTSRIKLFVVTSSTCLVLFLLVGAVVGRGAGTRDAYRHFQVITEVLSRIKSEYVEEPDMEGVTLGALNGLLEAIDPYASYLDEDQYRQYRRSLEQDQAGVGLVLSRRVGYVSVVDAVPGSPADKAGLQTGDMIEAIDGVATRDMPLAYAEMLLRGRAGSSVTLTVLRVQQGAADPQDIEVAREKVASPAVESQMLDDGIGLIQVRSLEEGKTAEVAKHLSQLMDDGAQKILLDLRRSATGEPEEGLALADLFLDNGLMVYLQGQKHPRENFQASSDDTVCRLPMVVAVNRGTAQGAEIAAVALQANDRAEVVGERTYGDASVRQAVPLQESGAVILSVAKYHAPDGTDIQNDGVTPSVVQFAAEPLAPIDGEEPRIEPVPEVPISEDAIIQRAIQVLRQGPSNVAQGQDSDMEPVRMPGSLIPQE